METKIISVDISPERLNENQIENAGVMWEHNATALVFNIDEAYIGDYRYYLEYRSLLGTKVRTEYLTLDTKTNTVSYTVPITMSSLKGVECYFNIVLIDDDGNTGQIIKPYKFNLQFDYSPDTDNSIAKVNDFSINALLEAIRLGTFKGDKGEKGDTGEKGDKGDKGDPGDVTTEYVNKTFAPAIKSVACGKTVTIEDFSSVEHMLDVRLHGKNLFDISRLAVQAESNSVAWISAITDSSITISSNSGDYCNTGKKLKEVCPTIKAGKTYIINGESEATVKRMYINDTKTVWTFGAAHTVTEADLNSTVSFYGVASSGGTSTCVISNIQIEQGDTATDYTPYIDVSTVVLTCYGADETDNPQTRTPNVDGTVEGIASALPKMTFTTNNEGITIEVEYNRDTSAAVDEKLDNKFFTVTGELDISTMRVVSVDKTMEEINEASQQGKVVTLELPFAISGEDCVFIANMTFCRPNFINFSVAAYLSLPSAPLSWYGIGVNLQKVNGVETIITNIKEL